VKGFAAFRTSGPDPGTAACFTLHRKADSGSLEKQINDLLVKRQYGKLIFLGDEDKRVWRSLQTNLYRTDEDLRWRSIEAIALLLHRQWDCGRREKVLDYLRGLVWSISDESGGIGWSAPQAIAEIVAAIPQLADPFANIMIDRALNEPALLKEGLWGIGRLGLKIKLSAGLFRELILASFTVDDTETLGLAAWATGEIRLEAALPFLQRLKRRKESVRIYISPRFREKQLGSWAKAAISKIENAV
jgi:hypothetical protein